MPFTAAIVNVLTLPEHIGELAVTVADAFWSGFTCMVGFVVNTTLLHPAMDAVTVNVYVAGPVVAFNTLLVMLRFPLVLARALPSTVLF